MLSELARSFLRGDLTADDFKLKALATISEFDLEKLVILARLIAFREGANDLKLHL